MRGKMILRRCRERVGVLEDGEKGACGVESSVYRGSLGGIAGEVWGRVMSDGRGRCALGELDLGCPSGGTGLRGMCGGHERYDLGSSNEWGVRCSLGAERGAQFRQTDASKEI